MKATLLIPVLFSSAAGFAADGPKPSANPTLIIRVHNTSSASESELQEMKESASKVLIRSGIEVEWVSCSSSSRHSALCPDTAGSAGRTIVFVRLVDQRLGSLLGRADHRTSSLVIFYETACAIEQSTNQVVTKGQILGHGVAHEIGHLLLESDTHSRIGIMKENYGRTDILTMGQGRLLFSAEESRLLRQTLRSRAERAAESR